MKNRKKKTGMIYFMTAVMILLLVMGLFLPETALAAEQPKAVTAFRVCLRSFEAHEKHEWKKIAGIPDLGPASVRTGCFYGTNHPAGPPDPVGNAVKFPKIPLPDIKLPKIGFPRIELPEIDFSKIDKEAEKAKLREALEEMDKVGISPKMLLRRAWTFFFPEDAGKQTGEKAGKQTGEKAGKQTGEKTGEKAGKQTGEKTGSQEREPVTEKVKRKASEEFDKAVDQAAEKVKEKASEELDKAVEQAIGKERKTR